jgi:proteasome lid subunit RPN8/RPN11
VISSWIGLALILYPVFVFSSGTKFPALNALPVIIGSMLLIQAGKGSSIPKYGVNWILKQKPLVFIGLCSYSFYLWHWPFFSYHKYIFFKAPELPTAWMYIFLSFGISILSLHFVERPFRGNNLLTRRSHVFLFGICSSAVVLAISLSIHLSQGAPERLPPKVVEYDAVSSEPNFANDRPVKFDGETFWHIGNPEAKPSVFLWGDSHAIAALPAFAQVCREHNSAMIAGIILGQPPVISEGSVATTSPSHHYNTAAMNYIIDDVNSIKHVVFIFFWHGNFNKPGFTESLLFTLDKLQAKGVTVTIFKELPVYEVPVPRAVALHHLSGSSPPYLSQETHRKKTLSYEKILESIQGKFPEIEIIDPAPLYQNKNGSFYYTNEDGALLYKDFSHLTVAGSFHLLPAVRMALSRADKELPSG